MCCVFQIRQTLLIAENHKTHTHISVSRRHLSHSEPAACVFTLTNTPATLEERGRERKKFYSMWAAQIDLHALGVYFHEYHVAWGNID